MTGHTRDRPLSQRHEPCINCEDPLFVCPGTLRRFLRCCDTCTHHTEHDRNWQTTTNPPAARPVNDHPAPNDPALLEAS